MTFTLLIDYIGTFAFAISGIRRASAKRFDLFGAVVVGFATACGGGTLRDILLGQTPFWMQIKSPFWEGGFTYLLVVLLALVAVSGLGRYLMRMNDTLFIFDAIGLGLFTVVGIEKSLACGFPIWVAIIMGTITGAGGGVFRDIFINVEPLIFRKDIYALACVFGGLFFAFCREIEMNSVMTQILTATSVIAIRFLAMAFHWRLPVLRKDAAEYDETDGKAWQSYGKNAEEGVENFDIEVVAISMEDIANINESQASRVEIYSTPELGGLTPSREFMIAACAQSRVPVRIMIRPTARDFIYTDAEFDQMLSDVAFVRTETKAEGIFVGILNEDFGVNEERMRKLVKEAGRLKITFNHAFEKLADPVAAYATLGKLGIDSVIAEASDALDNIPRSPVKIRVGGGLNPSDLPSLRARGLMRIHMGRAVREKLSFERPIDPTKIWEFAHD